MLTDIVFNNYLMVFLLSYLAIFYLIINLKMQEPLLDKPKKASRFIGIGLVLCSVVFLHG